MKDIRYLHSPYWHSRPLSNQLLSPALYLLVGCGDRRWKDFIGDGLFNPPEIELRLPQNFTPRFKAPLPTNPSLRSGARPGELSTNNYHC